MNPNIYHDWGFGEQESYPLHDFYLSFELAPDDVNSKLVSIPYFSTGLPKVTGAELVLNFPIYNKKLNQHSPPIKIPLKVFSHKVNLTNYNSTITLGIRPVNPNAFPDGLKLGMATLTQMDLEVEYNGTRPWSDNPIVLDGNIEMTIQSSNKFTLRKTDSRDVYLSDIADQQGPNKLNIILINTGQSGPTPPPSPPPPSPSPDRADDIYLYGFGKDPFLTVNAGDDMTIRSFPSKNGVPKTGSGKFRLEWDPYYLDCTTPNGQYQDLGGSIETYTFKVRGTTRVYYYLEQFVGPAKLVQTVTFHIV